MKTPFMKLLPLLILYGLLTVKLASNTLSGDEGGYYAMAMRLAHGHLQPENGVTLWWGPGYPAVLAVLAYLKLPLLAWRVLNPFFLFGAVVYFYKTLRLYVRDRPALALSYILGLYPPTMREVHLLLTESLVLLLVCGFAYNFCKLIRNSGSPLLYGAQAALFLGFLAMVKVFYGYVILTGLVVCVAAMVLWRDKRPTLSAGMFLTALILCLPYLYYTHSLTRNFFYWGSSGGCNLYWMSSPYRNDLGDWRSKSDVENMPELSPHKAIYSRGQSISEVERDRLFKEQAVYNISCHPQKYLVNLVANVGRLVFSYPFSYTPQKISTFFYLIPNMFIVVMLTLAVYPALKRWRLIPFELQALMFFALAALGGTSLMAAVERQFRPLVPILLLWLAFVFLRLVKVRLKVQRSLPAGSVRRISSQS